MDAHEHIIAGEALLARCPSRQESSPARQALAVEATAHFTAALARAALVGTVVGPSAPPLDDEGPDLFADIDDPARTPVFDPDVVDLDPRQER